MNTDYRIVENSGDRREFQRYTFAVPALIEILSARRQKKLSLETANISAGGAFLRTNRPFPEGTRTKMVFFFPFDELRNSSDTTQLVVMNVTGRVQRSDNTGVAIQFNRDYKLKGY